MAFFLYRNLQSWKANAQFELPYLSGYVKETTGDGIDLPEFNIAAATERSRTRQQGLKYSSLARKLYLVSLNRMQGCWVWIYIEDRAEFDREMASTWWQNK